MGYYMGDYYGSRRGDYYRGDPGFFSFLGGLAKKAVGFIPGIGPTLSGALDMIGKKAGGAAATSAIQVASETGVRGGLKRVGGALLKHPVLTGAGAAGMGAIAGAVGHKILAGGHAKRHRRMNACNPRALRRALRRTHSFARFAKQVLRVEHRFKKPRGRWPHGFGKKRAK